MFELKNVCAGYGGMPVLDDVSLRVPDGHVIALIGPNGAGKTTTLRIASGLLHPTSGSVVIDDEPVGRCSPAELVTQGICHVPEGRAIFPSLTVRENLALFSRRGQERDAVELAVAAFPRLGERLGQTAGTMSGGEQQMLALSRAYVSSPRIVLLDEVSMGLAPTVVDEIFDFFQTLVATGAALLIVEQYVHRVLEVADHAYVLTEGRVLASGTPDELLSTDLFAAYLGSEFSETTS